MWRKTLSVNSVLVLSGIFLSSVSVAQTDRDRNLRTCLSSPCLIKLISGNQKQKSKTRKKGSGARRPGGGRKAENRRAAVAGVCVAQTDRDRNLRTCLSSPCLINQRKSNRHGVDARNMM
jgi:hypothetical protein